MAVKNFNMSELKNVVMNIAKGTFGVSMVCVTIPYMSRTKRATKEVNTFYGRVQKVAFMSNVGLGFDYENVVNRHLIKKGLEPKFKSGKPSGCTWVNFPYILSSDKNPEQKYLRVAFRTNSISNVVYLLDGRPIGQDDFKELQKWLPQPSTSKKQEDMGLDEEEQVTVRNYCVENVYMVEQSKKSYRVENVEELLRLF